MTEEELNEAKLLLEKRKVELEERKNERENSFSYRHIATIISLAAVLVSASGPITAYIQKQQEQSLAEAKFKADQEESDRKWHIEAVNYLSIHKDIISSNCTDDQIHMREVMLLAFPSNIVDAIFQGLEKRATSENCKKVWFDGLKAVDQSNTSNESTVSATPISIKADSSTESLIELLNGPTRRDVSNSLINDYIANKSKAEIIARLIDAANQVEKKATVLYRVHLYILFTLARIPGNWEGDANQIKKIKDLADPSKTDNMKDPTYKKWAIQAVNNAHEIPAAK